MAKLTVERALRQAKAHQLKGEHDQARALYSKILEAYPKNSRAKQGLQALLLPSPVSKVPPNPPQQQLNALMALYHQGQLAAVAEQAAALTEAYPGSVALWNIWGAANLGLRRLDAAVEGFQRASELSPAYPDAHNNMGEALKGQGKLDKAIAAFQHALAIKPDYAEAHNNMGVALKEQGKLEEAIAAYQRALEIKPDFAEAHNNMGNALSEARNHAEAMASYIKAIQASPNFITSNLLYSMSQLPPPLIKMDILSLLDKAKPSPGQGEVSFNSDRAFTRATLFHNAGRYAEAWSSLVEANEPFDMKFRDLFRRSMKRNGQLYSDSLSAGKIACHAGVLGFYGENDSPRLSMSC